jgi:hypothetical protein
VTLIITAMDSVKMENGELVRVQWKYRR